MALPARRRGPRVLTASAEKYSGPKTSYSKRQSEGWQQRALDYYEQIGEIRYASQFYARMISRVRIFPALLDEQGEVEPIEEGPPVDLLNRIQDPGGGRSQLQLNYGRLMFITGEGVLFGARIDTDEERWSFLWIDEVKEENGRTYRIDKDKQPIEEGVAYRLWRPSPRHSDLADAPLCSVQEVCEELILLTKAVQSTALTRLTKGLLLVPQEISPGPAEPIGDEDPENDPFMVDLIEHFIGQIENPGSAEARVPPIIEGSYEYLDRLRWMQMHDPQTDYLERDLRTEAIKRLAMGLDFPPEVLLGMTDANHWTARQVVHDMWRSHGAPVAEMFCDDISEAYLRPALKDAEYSEWAQVVVAYDDADVVIAPDRSEDADRAFDRGAISYKGYREMKGIPEAMEPSKDEHDEWLAWKMRNPLLLPDAPQMTPERGPQPSPEDARTPEEGPPEPVAGREGSRPESRTASARVLGAAELALVRCREVAGARIRSYQKSCPECLEPANGKPNALVASLIGPDVLKELNAPSPLKLVASGSDGFRNLLINWGFAETQAVALSEMVEVYAARTLYEKNPGPLPSGFAAHVERVQEVSDAVHDSQAR